MLEVINLTSYKIDKKFLEKVAQGTLKIADNKKIKEVSLVLVSENKIREINKKYRRQNKPTDVLSFEELNEIFICPSMVKKKAPRRRGSFKGELTRVFVHGILHLAGYDHEKSERGGKIMREKEDFILATLKIK